jgi:cytochrome c-type biogenesis protein CcmH
VKARSNALRLLGATAVREADLGEAMTAVANGIVTADAKAAFERAAAKDAADFKAQYFLGLAAEQDGKSGQAAEIWRKLLSATPADAPWRELIQQSLARVDPKAAMPGPGGDDFAAAEKLTPEQRTDMINGMVARLAARLQADGSDLEAWLRLLRAYMVLGDRDKARAAAADARRAIGSDPDKQRRLDDAIKSLDIPG